MLKAELQGASLHGAKLQGANLSGAQLQGARLANVHLDENTIFAFKTVSDTSLYVEKSAFLYNAIPAATHALRLKTRKVNRLRLHPAAYKKFQAEWKALPKTDRHRIYAKAYDYAANPEEFEKDFPQLVPRASDGLIL